jgi:hypothetical protein
MSLWLMLAIVVAAGAVGGLVNAFLTDNGFVWPRRETSGAFTVTRPGFLGSMLVGAIAAAVSWGLYGPFAASPVVGGSAAGAAAADASLTLSALVGAVLVGVGGGRWLTDQADKSMLKATAAQAAGSGGHREASAAIASATPARAFEIAGRF